MKELDIENEFVKLIYDYQEGIASIEQCIKLLEKYERQYEILLVAPGLPYEIENDMLVVRGAPRFEHLIDPSHEILDRLIEEKFFPFLSKTNAILNTIYPDHADIVFENKYFYHATARAYAATYANWASRMSWLNKSDWNYRNLYYGASLSDEVVGWLRALYEIVEIKTVQIK